MNSLNRLNKVNTKAKLVLLIYYIYSSVKVFHLDQCPIKKIIKTLFEGLLHFY